MITIAKLDEITKEQWLDLRKQGIGASEIAGVMGYSQWQTPLSIYLEKVSGQSLVEETLPMEIGKELEPFMRRKFAQWLRDNEGIEEVIFEPQSIISHSKYPFILCTPDDIFLHPTKGLVGAEYKTASEFKRGEFTDSEIPDQYYLQCQQCMYVTGLKEWYLAYLIGNRKYEVLIIPRNDEVIADIEKSCIDFWQMVQDETPPAPGGNYNDTQALKTLFPGGQGELELFDYETIYDELKKLETTKKHIEEQITGYKNQIMAAMGNHDAAVLGFKADGKPKKATWKQMADSQIKAHIRKGSRVFKTY